MPAPRKNMAAKRGAEPAFKDSAGRERSRPMGT